MMAICYSKTTIIMTVTVSDRNGNYTNSNRNYITTEKKQ